ncbi:DUF2254 domain-containing protein [Exiguobacterium flavidum]|uniref:DUF2254 domain-containing protein n=1 Tax=Exiguobacterium flavidum TaxID=2184695 RepID=UPI000DF76F96|nr:DUF2254 domain-containing protein [Exiguobacterium flavidum]
MRKQWKVLLREANWWWPLLYGIGGAVLTAAVLFVDTYDLFPKSFRTTTSLAQTIHSSVFTGLLTMMTFTFSTILVVLTTYSSQFSPRTLPTFIENKKIQHIFGVFIAAVTYSITSLLFMKPSFKETVVASGVAVLVVLIAVIAFVQFVHIVSQSIQVGRLLDTLHDEGIALIEEQLEHFTEGRHKVTFDIPSYAQPLLSPATGYVRLIDHDEILESGNVSIDVPIGDFVTEGQIIGTVNGGETEGIVVGLSRSAEQDLPFVLQKLAEVGLRAISPGINDPNTARHAIRYIGDLFRRHAAQPDGHLEIERDGKRLVMRRESFDRLLYLTFHQLRHYGKEDVSVIATMLEALMLAKRQALPEHAKAIDDFIPFILSGIEFSGLNEWDARYLRDWEEKALKPISPSSRNNGVDNF